MAIPPGVELRRGERIPRAGEEASEERSSLAGRQDAGRARPQRVRSTGDLVLEAQMNRIAASAVRHETKPLSMAKTAPWAAGFHQLWGCRFPLAGASVDMLDPEAGRPGHKGRIVSSDH